MHCHVYLFKMNFLKMTARPKGLHIFKISVIYCHQWYVWVFVSAHSYNQDILTLIFLGKSWSQWRTVNIEGYDIVMLLWATDFVYVELFTPIANVSNAGVDRFFNLHHQLSVLASVSIPAESSVLLISGEFVLCRETSALF